MFDILARVLYSLSLFTEAKLETMTMIRFRAHHYSIIDKRAQLGEKHPSDSTVRELHATVWWHLSFRWTSIDHWQRSVWRRMNERANWLNRFSSLIKKRRSEHRFNQLVYMSLQMMSNDPIERRMLHRQQDRSQVWLRATIPKHSQWPRVFIAWCAKHAEMKARSVRASSKIAIPRCISRTETRLLF